MINSSPMRLPCRLVTKGCCTTSVFGTPEKLQSRHGRTRLGTTLLVPRCAMPRSGSRAGSRGHSRLAGMGAENPDRSRRAVGLPDLAWLEQATTLTKLRAGRALTGYTHFGQVHIQHKLLKLFKYPAMTRQTKHPRSQVPRGTAIPEAEQEREALPGTRSPDARRAADGRSRMRFQALHRAK